MPAPTAGGLPPYVIAGILISFAGFIFVRFSRNAPAKRIIWPLAVVLFGTSFLSVPAHDPRFGWKFVALLSLPLSFMLLRYTFCSKCGETLDRKAFFRKPAFCSHCGTRLNTDA